MRRSSRPRLRQMTATLCDATGGDAPSGPWGLVKRTNRRRTIIADNSTMPRGSKPGERRGGRQRATPNKRTVLTDRILAVAPEHPGASRHELIAILVKDQMLAADIRLAVARRYPPVRASRSTASRAAPARAHDCFGRHGKRRRTRRTRLRLSSSLLCVTLVSSNSM